MIFKYKAQVFVLCIFSIAYIASAQDIKNPFLDAQFKSYETVKVNTSDLLSSIQAQRSGTYQLTFMGWNMQLTDSGILDERYQAVAYDGKSVRPLEKTNIKALQGYTDQGGRVSITINDHFVQGFVQTGMYTFYFEPVYHFDKNAARDQIVIYNTKDIIPGKEKNCGVTDSHQNARPDPRDNNTGERMPGGCYEVEYAIATDFSMFSHYGSTTGVQNHNIAVTNDMQTNYNDEFADGIQFVIVQQFIVTTSNGDPSVWTTTTDAGTLLNNFTSWGPTGFTSTHDVGSLWTRRDFDGSTVGIAWVGAVCTNARYNALQDFTSTASSKRVLLAHELGHNFSSNHDSGSGFIMSPSVNNTNTWSSTSVTSIQNHYLSRNCLANCVIGPPQISFNSTSSTVTEFGGSGTTGSCGEPFKLLNIPVSVNKAITSPITVTVSVSPSSTAQVNRDYTLVSSTLTFPSGAASTQNIQVRIIDDKIQENPESLILNIAISGGTGQLGTNATHTITINDLDEISTTCCTATDNITYGSNNGQGDVIFFGYYEDARTRTLFLPAQLNSAGLTAGYISSLQYFVQQKGSTAPYQNFRVSIANVPNTTLEGMTWVNTQEVYSGTITTVAGSWSEIIFDTPFYWNGTSSLYIQFCFDNNIWSANDFIRLTSSVNGITGRFIEVLYLDGANGCQLQAGSSNQVSYTNSQPHFRFKQISGAKIETAVSTIVKTNLKSGEQANFYSNNGKIIASVKNISATDINCIEASIETAGTGKLNLPFGGGEYSAKTIKIDASYNALYEVTLYYSQTELNTFGTNAGRLNMIKTSGTMANATLSNSTIYRPDSIISGFGPDNAYGYRGTFSGFSRFALTNRNTGTGSTVTTGDLVLSEAGRGIIFKNKSGNNFLITATNTNTISTQSITTPPPGTVLDKSDLAINTTGNNLVLRSPNNQYRRLSISNTGVLSLSSVSLPAVRAELLTGNIRVNESGGSLLMKSPNGTCWRIYMNESGQLRSVITLCP
jgi:hypothetical protein